MLFFPVNNIRLTPADILWVCWQEFWLLVTDLGLVQNCFISCKAYQVEFDEKFGCHSCSGDIELKLLNMDLEITCDFQDKRVSQHLPLSRCVGLSKLPYWTESIERNFDPLTSYSIKSFVLNLATHEIFASSWYFIIEQTWAFPKLNYHH